MTMQHGPPVAIILMPVAGPRPSLSRAVESAVRQRDVRCLVWLGLHGADEETAREAAHLESCHDTVKIVDVPRENSDLRTPARPLNSLLRQAIADFTLQADVTWILRLDSDDVLASDDTLHEQIAAGGGVQMITATAVFFDPAVGTAYRVGPHPSRRSWLVLRKHGAYCLAHPSNAVRLDLLRALPQVDFCDLDISFGEDLSFSCRLLAHVPEAQFRFVPATYCFKELSTSTATATISLSEAAKAHWLLWRRNPALSAAEVLRGWSELCLGSLVGESHARRLLHRTLGFCGWLEDEAYEPVRRRLNELSD